MPLVSVIIPTHNRARLLPRALASVIAQTLRNYECIVVDDASDDGTEQLDIVSAASQQVRYVRLPLHSGVSKARNTGVACSTGEWLAFLDSDDEWHPAKLEKQMAWLESRPGYRICQTKEIWIRHGRRVNPPATHEKKEEYIFEQSLKRCMVTPSSVVVDRALFLESGGFNESLPACEDYDLWLKITCVQPVGLVEDFLLTRYGGHPDQLSATVMGLDRFRIRSIIDLLHSNRLSPVQETLARAELVTKAVIVANGFKKRGKTEKYERYMRIADLFTARA
jgi:glycosyltransferase involved in cell wall biosynthesis